MLSLDVNHDNSEYFIDAKTDGSSVTGANISIKADDAFMRDIISPKRNHVSGKRNKLWKKIVHNAWAHAEPGLMFWDTIIRESPADCYAKFGFKTISTNPCFTGDMLLRTASGEEQFKSLVDTEFVAINKRGEKVLATVWSNGVKPVIKLNMGGGKDSMKLTPDHILMNTSGEEVMAKDSVGHRIMPFVMPLDSTTFDDTYVKLGFIQGDGTLSDLNAVAKGGITVNIGFKDADVLDLFGFSKNSENKRHFYTREYTDILNTLEFSHEIIPNRLFPATYDTWTDRAKVSFLRGMYSANGSVITNGRVAYKSTCKELIDKLQKELLRFGMESYVTTNKAKDAEFSNGVYTCKESYDLNVNKLKSVVKFAETIGFVHNYKAVALQRLIKDKAFKVTNFKNLPAEEVFDFNLQDDTHWGVVNGLVAHNCGEIPLCPYDSCRLMAINLSSYVINPFTSSAMFDFELFRQDVESAQKLMDDMIDLELEKIDAILAKIEADPESEEDKFVARNLWNKVRGKAVAGRRTGLGITAEGDMLAMMGLTYGTPKATAFATKVHKHMSVYSVAASVYLGAERGAFPIWNYELEKENPFLNRVFDAMEEILGIEEATDIRNDWKAFGRRNIATLTIAPTGTTSLMSQTTSGIEPVFMPVYFRNKKRTDEPESEVAITDEVGDQWVQFAVVHPGLKQWAEINGKLVEGETPDWTKLAEESPYNGATAMDVDWKEKVKMQGEIQKWVDHSINTFVA